MFVTQHDRSTDLPAAPTAHIRGADGAPPSKPCRALFLFGYCSSAGQGDPARHAVLTGLREKRRATPTVFQDRGSRTNNVGCRRHAGAVLLLVASALGAKRERPDSPEHGC